MILATRSEELALLAARGGLTLGTGPFWDPSQLCGRSLFAAWGQPWSSPWATVLLSVGPWPFFLTAFLGTWLLARRCHSWTRWAWSLASVLLLIKMPWGLQAGLALAPWALWALEEAPFGGASAVLALLVTTLSAGPLGAVLLLDAYRRKSLAQSAARLGLALLLAAPAWLPLLLRSPMVMELGLAWPVAAPSEWVLSLAWAALVIQVRGAAPRPSAKGTAVMLALLGLTWGMQRPWTSSAASNLDAPHYNQSQARYLDAEGDPRLLARSAAGLAFPSSFVGSLDGRGSLIGLRRWKHLAFLGSREPDLLSLAAVGWIAGPHGAGGSRWSGPVAAALVDSAMTLGQDEPRWTGFGLFERPLKVAGPLSSPGQGSTWHILTPEGPANSQSQINLTEVHHDGWVFLSQSYDPGWQAWSQNSQGQRQSLTVRATEGDFLAVPVESTVSTVHFDYQPPWLTWAYGLFVLGWLLWFLKESKWDRQAH